MIGVIDLVDVALVALFLYGFIIWLRQGASRNAVRRALVIGLLFGGAYFLARSLGLFLVERLLQLLLIAYLLITVVVFQNDVRRMLNRVAPWGLFPTSSSTALDLTLIDLLVETTVHLAETKTGALIALRGRESWDDYIHGGVTLDGVVSQPLLYSLFNPETPGHDGAVLIDGNRITKFAAHIPLASDLPEVSRYGGTRHAAALGLSEHCDALVVVVSEERGTISVAQGNELAEVASASELKDYLERFSQRNHAGPSDRSLRWWHWFNLPVALLSVALAASLWLFLVYSPNVIYRSLEVPVEFRNLPEGWELIDTEVETVRVTLAGPEQAFGLFDPRALVISLDLSDLEEGENSFEITENHLGLPSRVSLYSANPAQVRTEAWPLVLVEVPVEVQTIGFLPSPFILVSVNAEPEAIALLVPRAIAQEPGKVVTEPVDMRTITASAAIEARLELPLGWRLPEDVNPQVVVTLEVQPRQ